MAFFYENHFNVFTDTSDKTLKTARGDIKITCPGFLATYNGKVLGSGLEIYVDEDTLFGEAKAIELAVRWIQNTIAARYNINRPFNIFSDNLPVVATICNYINAWIAETSVSNKVMFKYTGVNKVGYNWENVAYSVACTIFGLNYPIYVYYTPGHVPIYKLPFKDFDTNSNKFMDKNKRYHNELSKDVVNPYVVYEMATFNNMVDIMTRNYIFRNRDFVKNDIERAGESIALGGNKGLPLRWPFIVPNVPTLHNYLQQGNKMLPPAQ